MSLRTYIYGQFRRPSGPLGHVAGWIMASRGSNRDRGLWAVDLLDIRPDDRVLEFGCGPGASLEAITRRLESGHAMGFDHSAVMIAQATRRNRDAIAAGRLELRLAPLEEIVRLEPGFTKILSVNVIQFVADKDALYRMLFDKLAPGGGVATTYQPRHKNPTRADALAMGETIREAMSRAGFTAIRQEEHDFKPVPAICVLGRKPG